MEYSMVLIEWSDATLYDPLRTEHLSANERTLNMMTTGATIKSVGYLINETGDGYLIAGDLEEYNDETSRPTCRVIRQIPKTGVHSVSVLHKSRRK